MPTPSLSIQTTYDVNIFGQRYGLSCEIASLSDFKVRSNIINDVTVGHYLMSCGLAQLGGVRKYIEP